MLKDRIKSRRKEADAKVESLKDKSVLIKGGFKGRMLDWARINGLGEIECFKVEVDNKTYEIWRTDIIGIEYGKDKK